MTTSRSKESQAPAGSPVTGVEDECGVTPMLVLDSNTKMEDVITQAKVAVSLSKGWECKFVRSGQCWLKYDRTGIVKAVCTIRRVPQPNEWVWFRLRAMLEGEQLCHMLGVPLVLILSTDGGILYRAIPDPDAAELGEIRMRIEDKDLGPEPFVGYHRDTFKPAKEKP